MPLSSSLVFSERMLKLPCSVPPQYLFENMLTKADVATYAAVRDNYVSRPSLSTRPRQDS
jgi:hypothetical protein